MTLDDKISSAVRTITAALDQYRKPCVLWSGGKDSMVLLHLLRGGGYHFPVVCWREPWMPWKQRFVNRIIDAWSLEVWDYAPSAVALCKGNGRIDVMQHYQIGAGAMILARGTEPPEEGKPWLCGRDTFLSRPVGSFAFPWDGMFHGHKSCDADPTSGGVPLKVDVLHTPGSAASIYPLREWTDEDVFAYIDRFGVPYDESRYARTPSGWTILPEKDGNPDYYHTCFRCCDPDAPAFVACPKLGVEINNIAGQLRFIAPAMAYCGLRQKEEAGVA